MGVGARCFSSLTEAEQWIEETFRGWANALTEAEREAITAYKGTAYRELNEALRVGYSHDEQLVEDLDVALARFQLTEPVITYRAALWTEIDPPAAGDQLVDAAYVSTSLLRDQAHAFAEPHGYLAEILIPGGAQVGVFLGAPDLIHPLHEAELLLPRDSAFEISETIADEPDPIPTLRMEVMP